MTWKRCFGCCCVRCPHWGVGELLSREAQTGAFRRCGGNDDMETRLTRLYPIYKDMVFS